MGAEDFFPLGSLIVAQDDRLSSTTRQLGEGIFVSHAPGKAQGVLDGVIKRVVIPEAGAANTGSANGTVNGNDSTIAGSWFFRI